ncbi:MAG TPA: FBP domain-containing protein [Archangium sp.]
MFKLDSEEALVKAFRPKDRQHVEVIKELQFPMIVTDYVGWVHPSGGCVFLVFAAPKGPPIGIVFDSNGGSGPGVVQMCDWCHGHAGGSGVGMLTAKVNSKRRVGVYACIDLSCAQKLEDEANRNGSSPRPAMEKLIQRMGRFANEALGIDLMSPDR